MKPNTADSSLAISDDVVSGAARYEILKEVARGGMGIVYRARHRTLGMDVAIKVMLPGRSIDRFMREAKLLAKIQSPHVVKITDFDVLPEGKPMLVMEWVEGLDLQGEIQAGDGRILEAQALSWMKDVCEGMIAAAREGIVHRDLKPSNVMIDQHGRAKVADFGLARLSESGQSNFTSDGNQAMGTPHYMAPEQAEDARSADTRSDIYSFGAMFYHALTGKPPFEGESSFAILLKHKLDPLISPKARCPELSEATSQLLERCLAKSPRGRFQSFAEVLKNLSRKGAELAWAANDDAALIPYYKGFASRFPDYVLGRIAQLSDLYQFPDGRRLLITYGNIVRQDVDAIVSSDNSDLTMSHGVSLAIRRAAGDQVREEAQRLAPVRPGRVIVTTSGNLPARFIFHGVTVGWGRHADQMIPSADLIVEIMESCLYHADTLSVHSMAFPLLGTGAAGLPGDVCLNTMFRFLCRTLLHGVTSLNAAAIVLYGRHPLPYCRYASRVSVSVALGCCQGGRVALICVF